MSPRSVQRFWDNDMHRDKDLKPAALIRFSATRFKPLAVVEFWPRCRISVVRIVLRCVEIQVRPRRKRRFSRTGLRRP
ncbi:hypothetical protein FJ425_25135 [Mesorhizobium sp. B2-7-2]|nr:hypothetical protein FJ425_25135 [Mesorhizobium sp. B2-7-2]